MNRLFVAAWPPPAVVTTLSALPRTDDPAVRWIPPANWHVTLRFCGDVDADALAAAFDGATLPAARAVLGPAVTTMPRTKPPHVIAPVAGVDDLAAAVHDATSGLVAPEERRFRGHITIARVRRTRQSNRVATDAPLVGTPVNAAWDVDEVTLVASELHPDGARYAVIARWPLPA